MAVVQTPLRRAPVLAPNGSYVRIMLSPEKSGCARMFAQMLGIKLQ